MRGRVSAVLDTDTLRVAIKKKMEAEDLSLRDIEAVTAVSAATLSRLLCGRQPNIKTYEILSGWINGKKYERKIRKISSRSITVNGKRFIVTIEAM